MAREIEFPKKFLWGASVSAHQVEGGLHNQWTVWELENAKALSVQAEYHYNDLESWPQAKQLAKLSANYVSGRATDHFRRFETDFDLAKQLRLTAFRFSIEWSRVEPEEGMWNAEAIDYYKQYVAALRGRGLEPVMTLFHFTLPVWFAQQGGFEKRSNIHYFVRFAEKIVSELGGSVRYILTINEPEVYAFESYEKGHWPPAHLSFWQALKVYRNLAVAHNRVYTTLHELRRTYKISYAKHSIYMYPGDDAWLTRMSAGLGQWLFDDYWIRKTIKKADFLGITWHTSQRVYGYRVHNPEQRMSDLGTSMDPGDIEHSLARLYQKYKKPLLITGNGVADGEDSFRKWWLSETVMAMQRAIRSGVPVIGYIYQSLTDGFEWDKGRWPRFGLYKIDYRTLERTPRASAVWFGKLLKKLRSE